MSNYSKFTSKELTKALWYTPFNTSILYGKNVVKHEINGNIHTVDLDESLKYSGGMPIRVMMELGKNAEILKYEIKYKDGIIMSGVMDYDKNGRVIADHRIKFSTKVKNTGVIKFVYYDEPFDSKEAILSHYGISDSIKSNFDWGWIVGLILILILGFLFLKK